MANKKPKKINLNEIELEMERCRIRGVQMVLDGKKQREVAELLGVTEGAVSQWMTSFEEDGWNGIYAKQKSGRNPTFTEEHTIRLFNIITQKPQFWGYDTDLWKVSMARNILFQQTDDVFSNTRILTELYRLRLSYQKPEIRAFERNKEKIDKWINETYPKILREAIISGAHIFFEDESGISLNIFSGKTWSLKGETPVVYRSGQRTKKTIASVISTDGELFFQTYDGGTNGEKYIDFLKAVDKIDDKSKIIIHDKLPSHRAIIVKEFVESTNGKLKLYELPGYSPHLNPDEMVWANLKKDLGKKANKNLEELEKNAVDILAEMKNDKAMLVKMIDKVYGKTLVT